MSVMRVHCANLNMMVGLRVSGVLACIYPESVSHKEFVMKLHWPYVWLASNSAGWRRAKIGHRAVCFSARKWWL